MATPLQSKSSPSEIRDRFDNDVERFSNLETGQSATIDAPLAMELITRAAVSSRRSIQRVLDIGCGAGNNTLKLREVYGQDFESHLLDLSQPMLKRAKQRVSEVNRSGIFTTQADFREAYFAEGSFDVVLAAAVFHHLRSDEDWQTTFEKVFRLLTPGGSVWITDLVTQESAAVQSMMWARYGEYLCELNGPKYRDQVFAYIDKEDSPRPVTYQLELLREVGFETVELLHKNSCFAAFGAIKANCA